MVKYMNADFPPLRYFEGRCMGARKHHSKIMMQPVMIKHKNYPYLMSRKMEVDVEIHERRFPPLRYFEGKWGLQIMVRPVMIEVKNCPVYMMSRKMGVDVEIHERRFFFPLCAILRGSGPPNRGTTRDDKNQELPRIYDVEKNGSRCRNT